MSAVILIGLPLYVVFFSLIAFNILLRKGFVRPFGHVFRQA
jgi:hypothetical protein